MLKSFYVQGSHVHAEMMLGALNKSFNELSLYKSLNDINALSSFLKFVKNLVSLEDKIAAKALFWKAQVLRKNFYENLKRS